MKRQPPTPRVNGFARLWAKYDKLFGILSGNEHKLLNVLRINALRKDGSRKGYVRKSFRAIARDYNMAESTVRHAFKKLHFFGIAEYRPSGIYLLDVDQPVPVKYDGPYDGRATGTSATDQGTNGERCVSHCAPLRNQRRTPAQPETHPIILEDQTYLSDGARGVHLSSVAGGASREKGAHPARAEKTRLHEATARASVLKTPARGFTVEQRKRWRELCRLAVAAAEKGRNDDDEKK